MHINPLKELLPKTPVGAGDGVPPDNQPPANPKDARAAKQKAEKSDKADKTAKTGKLMKPANTERLDKMDKQIEAMMRAIAHLAPS